MIGAVLELLPFVVALYFIECVYWTRPSHLLVKQWPWQALTACRNGLHLGGILPWQEVLRVPERQLLITPEGVFVRQEQALSASSQFDRRDFAFWTYGELEEPSVEANSVRFGRYLNIPLPSKQAAHLFSELLIFLRELPREERARGIETLLKHAYDLRKVSSRRSFVRSLLFPLRSLNTVQFFAIFCLLPLSVFGNSLPWTRSALLLIAFLLLYSLAETFRATRTLRLHGLSVAGKGIAASLVSPPAAIRSTILVSQDLFSDFDYLAIVAATLEISEFRLAARAELYSLHTAIHAGDKDPTWRTACQSRYKALLSLARDLGLDEDDVFAPPTQSGPDALSFCPLCHSEFQMQAGECPDCTINIISYLAPKASSETCC